MSPIPEALPTTDAAPVALSPDDAARFAGEVNAYDVAFVLDLVATSMIRREAPPVNPVGLAQTLAVASALLRRDSLPPTPSYSRTPDTEALEVAADRLAGLASPADLMLAGVCRRVARELVEGLAATRAGADVWDRATAYAGRLMLAAPKVKTKFADNMRAERNRLWPKLTPRSADGSVDTPPETGPASL